MASTFNFITGKMEEVPIHGGLDLSKVPQNVAYQPPAPSFPPPGDMPKSVLNQYSQATTPAPASQPTPSFSPPGDKTILNQYSQATTSVQNTNTQSEQPPNEGKVNNTENSTLFTPVTQTEKQSTFTGGYTVPEKLKKEYEDAQGAKEKAVKDITEAEQQKANIEANYAIEKAKFEASINEHTQKNEEYRQQKINEDQEKIKNSLEDIKNTKIDPNKLYASMSTGQKITAAIAIMLGGAGAALSKQDNLSMKVLNNAIDADIDAQKTNLSKKLQSLEQQRGMLRDNLAVFNDQRQAEAATRIQLLGVAESKLQELLAKNKNQEIEARGQMALAELQEEKAKQQIKFDESSKSKVNTTINTQTKMVPMVAMDEQKTKYAGVLRENYDKKVSVAKENLTNVKQLEAMAKPNADGTIDGATANALKYMVTRMATGVGAITDNDLAAAGLSRSVFDRMSASINRGFFGDMTNQEIESIRTLAKIKKQHAIDEIANSAESFIELSKQKGLDPNYVVIDPDDVVYAMNKKQKKSSTSKRKAGK